MKNFVVILAFVALQILLISCGEEDVALLSELQQRDGVYVVPKTQKPYSGKFVTAYKNNVIKEAGSLKYGKRHGEIKNYNENGQLIWVVHYKDGIIDVQRGSFTDSRDGKSYKTIKVGSQTWFAENLNYEASGSKCYENNPSNCQKYGRLYDWETAMKACPSGWHLPSEDESEVLENIAGDFNGRKLKTKSGWNNNGNGTDEFWFSALPGGYGFSDGSFGNFGNRGYWWSSSENNSNSAYYRNIDCDSEYARWNNYYKSGLFSIRCLQD